MTAPNFETNDPIDTTENLQSEDSDQQTEDSQESPEAPSTEPAAQSNEELRILQTYAQNAAKQNQYLQQQLAEMQQQLAGVSRTVQKETPRAPIVTDEDFQSSPAAAMERLFEHKLEEKLNATIAPLLETARKQQREQTFKQNFVSTLSAINPALSQYADSMAPEVLSMLGDADPTPQNLQMATLMTIGKYAVSGGAAAPQTTSAPAMPANNSSARVPASAPSNTPRSTSKGARKLSEAELRSFNKLGYKPGQEADFLEMLNAEEVRF